MLTIDKDNTIHLTRGDTARLLIDRAANLATGKDYEFKPTDVVEMAVKKSVCDETALIRKSVSGGEAIHILPEDTKPLAFGRYVYDVQLTTAEGDVYTVVTLATFEVTKEVT